jgi:hypothetical protein
LVLNGLSWWITDCVGEIKDEKTGGVRMLSKKTRSLREPFLLLHDLQAILILDSSMASSGLLDTGMMWSMVRLLPSCPS